MNCRYARQLISPYLDQQLTGREMLDLREHFAQCPYCAEEMDSILQVKRLLRGLHTPAPSQKIAEAIGSRLTESEMRAGGWRILSLPPTLVSSSLVSSHLHPSARPPRGRRLVTALGLSCLTVLSIAAPFAPASRDGGRMTSGFLSSAFLMPSLVPSPATPSLPSLSNTEAANSEILDQTPAQIAPTQEVNWTMASFSTATPRSDLSVFPVPMLKVSSVPARLHTVPPADYSR